MSELWEVLTEHFPEFSSGLWVTFRLVAIAFVIAMVVGTLIAAALSLGLSYPRTMRRIILPQAFRTVIPALGSLVIAMIKNSAIVGASLVALPDLLKQAREVQADTAQPDEVYFWGAVGFLLLTVTATLIFRYLEHRYAIRR